MKVLLIQYGLNPYGMHAVCGRSGKVYGHASHNPRLSRHEFAMPLEQFNDPKTHKDLMDNLRRPGCQWFPIFQVSADSAAGELETVKADRDALAAEVAALKAEVEALKAELIGDEAEAVSGDLQEQKHEVSLTRRGMNYLRKTARKLGHPMTGNPTKESLIAFITEKQSETAAV